MQPTFALTFDFELMWGSFDRMPQERFESLYPDMRGTIRAILDRLDAYDIPVTWAVVGHLFLGSCSPLADDVAHAGLRDAGGGRPAPGLAVDPGSERSRAPLWYADDLVDAIRATRTVHEIGSHSFTHPMFDSPTMTRAMARAELSACVEVARARGIELRSFVFPRNRQGFHDVLREMGFTAYRGVDVVWYDDLPRSLARPAHLLDQALGVPPIPVHPVETLPGLWNIPGSMLLLHRVGVRRRIPVASRLRKVHLGLDRVTRGGGVFHLWTHPMNLAHDRPAMLRGFEAMLREVATLRDRGALRVLTMAEIAEDAAAATAASREIA